MRLASIIIAVILPMLILSQTVCFLTASPPSTHYSYVRTLTLYAPAVARSGGGALIQVNLTLAYPGSGMVYFTARPLVEVDTQATARIASYVASVVTGHNYYDYDYYVVMTSKSLVVGGPSAGALMTIGFIALFMNKTVNPYVCMTGMINPDGSIGPVGGLVDKLDAVSKAGYKYFLIPLGQRIVYVEKRIIKNLPWGYYETVKYEPVDLVKLGDEKGVKVIEVGSIFDAMKYFLNTTMSAEISTPEINKEIISGLKEYAEKNYEKASELYNDSQQLFKKLDMLTRIQLYSRYKNINEMINRLKDMLDKKYYVSAYYYSYDVLQQSLSLNLLLKILVGEEKINNLIESLYQSINETYKIIRNTSISNGINPINIDIHMDFYKAINTYTSLISKNETSYTSEDVDSIAKAMIYLYMIHQLYNLTRFFENYNVDLNESLMTLYSIADSVVSYAYSLASDVGGSNQYINNAMKLFSMGIDAYTKNYTLASIGLFIQSIVYADLGIELLFINKEDVLINISDYLSNELSIYYSLMNKSNYLALLYLLGKEYRLMKQPADAIASYMKGVMTIIMLNSKIKALGLIEENNNPLSEIPSPTKTPSNSTNNTNTTQITINTTPLMERYYREIVYFLLGVFAGILIGLLIYKAMSDRRKVETVFTPI